MRDTRESFQVVLVVVELDGKYLVVHEASHGQLWYLPAGGVEANETIAEGAIRETKEEAGIDIEPIGLLRMEEHLRPNGVYVQRFVVSARPLTTTPKSQPDHHSLEARFLTYDEIAKLPLRDPEVLSHITDHRRGAPLSVAPDGFRVRY